MERLSLKILIDKLRKPKPRETLTVYPTFEVVVAEGLHDVLKETTLYKRRLEDIRRSLVRRESWYRYDPEGPYDDREKLNNEAIKIRREIMAVVNDTQSEIPDFKKKGEANRTLVVGGIKDILGYSLLHADNEEIRGHTRMVSLALLKETVEDTEVREGKVNRQWVDDTRKMIIIPGIDVTREPYGDYYLDLCERLDAFVTSPPLQE